MKHDIPEQLRHSGNRRVLDYLDGRSSHGDLSEKFLQTIQGLDSAKGFCPDPRSFAYCFVYVNSQIFGFCRSMRSLSFQLPEGLYDEACEDGGVLNEAFDGVGWFDFPAFDSVIKSNLVAWAEAAYLNAQRQK